MNQDYVGTTKRTFKAAVVHLLETNYGMVGSRRILNLLADDLQTLVDQFYPAPEHISSGWMVFTGTKAKGPKAHPGQSASDYELVTLAWPCYCLKMCSVWPACPKDRQELEPNRLCCGDAWCASLSTVGSIRVAPSCSPELIWQPCSICLPAGWVNC
jgi:hypothetical protein